MIVYDIYEAGGFKSATNNIDDFIKDYRNCIRSSLRKSFTALNFDININNTFIITNENYNKLAKGIDSEIANKFIEKLVRLMDKCLSYEFNDYDFRIVISDLYSARIDDFICKFTVKEIDFIFPIEYLLNNFEDLIELRKIDIVKYKYKRKNPLFVPSKIYFANLEGFEEIISNKVKINRITDSIYTTITPENIMKVIGNIKSLTSDTYDVKEIYPYNIVFSFGYLNTIRNLHQSNTITIRRDEKVFDEIFGDDYKEITKFIKDNYHLLTKIMFRNYKIPKQYFKHTDPCINIYYTLFNNASELLNIMSLSRF